MTETQKTDDRKSKTILVLNRDLVLTSTKGHSVRFKKNVPTHVPPNLYTEALAIGAQPADGSAPDVGEATGGVTTPVDPAERAAAVLDAVDQIFGKNERNDFTAAGTPTVKAVEKILGFNIDSREVQTAVKERNERIAGEKDN